MEESRKVNVKYVGYAESKHHQKLSQFIRTVSKTSPHALPWLCERQSVQQEQSPFTIHIPLPFQPLQPPPLHSQLLSPLS
jgi:hypothetical protein